MDARRLVLRGFGGETGVGEREKGEWDRRLEEWKQEKGIRDGCCGGS